AARGADAGRRLAQQPSPLYGFCAARLLLVGNRHHLLHAEGAFLDGHCLGTPQGARAHTRANTAAAPGSRRLSHSKRLETPTGESFFLGVSYCSPIERIIPPYRAWINTLFMGDRMPDSPLKLALDRREFLSAAGGALLAGAVPADASAPGVAQSLPAAPPASMPASSLRKIPIGVFDPVYEHLGIDEMLDRVSALGLEAMEIGTGGYPDNHHCPLDDLIADRSKAKAWLKKFEDKNIRVATLSCHGNPIHPDAKRAQKD